MSHTASRRKPDLTRNLTDREKHKIHRRGADRKRQEDEGGKEFPTDPRPEDLVTPANFIHPAKRRSK